MSWDVWLLKILLSLSVGLCVALAVKANLPQEHKILNLCTITLFIFEMMIWLAINLMFHTKHVIHGACRQIHTMSTTGDLTDSFQGKKRLIAGRTAHKQAIPTFLMSVYSHWIVSYPIFSQFTRYSRKWSQIQKHLVGNITANSVIKGVVQIISGCMRFLTVSVLPTVEGGWHAPSLEEQSTSMEAQQCMLWIVRATERISATAQAKSLILPRRTQELLVSTDSVC